MKITYAIFHGSRAIGHGLVASSPAEIAKIIEDLNSLNDGLKYTHTIVKISQ